MGIDAELVIKYRGEKPTDEQLTRWSWDLCRSIGARHFLVSDGLPALDYYRASEAWHAAFNAHKLHPEFERLRNQGREAWGEVRKSIIADIGAPPERRRRAIEFCGESNVAWADTDAEAAHADRNIGLLYTQDGDDVLAAPGEYLLQVSLRTRYYDVGYERGDLLTICAVAEWIEANMQPCDVWYGGDSSGVCIEPFGEPKRRELRRHLFSQQGRDYFNYSGWGGATPPMPKPCGLCVPGEERRQQYGSGMNGKYAAVSCAGCGKNFETHDGGTTWAERKND